MRRLLLVLAAGLLALPAAAQQVPIVQAGAEGRFERQIDAKSKVEGFSPAQVAAFRAAIAPVIEQLAAMPGVNNPPAPICHRLGSWVQLVNPDGVLGAEISMLTPISFENGRCHRMTAGGLQIWVNRPNGGLDPSHSTVRSPQDGGSPWYVLPIRPARDPRLVEYQFNGDDYTIFTRGRPLLRPVTMERYLRHQAQALPKAPENWAAKLAALAPAQRGQPACLGARWAFEPNGACDPARTLVEVDPAYFDRSRPADVQLLILTTPSHRYHGESDAELAVRTAVLKALDRAALAARVR